MKPTATETAQATPTDTSTPEPTATLVPTPEPTATLVPTATPQPRDTSSPVVIVVDFYAGNTTRNPGPENCNPRRCGGVLIQFSEPVLTHGEIFLHVRGKGLLDCIQGCSDEKPASYMVFTSGVWIESGDEIYEPAILQDGLARIVDSAGNELDSYELDPDIRERASDFAMVQGPTPVPIPVPPAASGQSPYVTRLDYEGTVVNLHLSEPVQLRAHDISDVGINVRLPDGSVTRGVCVAPCDGSDAALSFDTPELTPDSIAVSFDFRSNAQIHDSEQFLIQNNFEEVTLRQIPRIENIEVRVSEVTDNDVYPWIGFPISFSDFVTMDSVDSYLLTDDGIVLPCHECIYGPNLFGTYAVYGQDIYEYIETPLDLVGQTIIELIVVDGAFLSKTGQICDLSFDPILIDP